MITADKRARHTGDHGTRAITAEANGDPATRADNNETLFFDKIKLENGGPHAAMISGRHLVAAQDTLLITLVLIAVAFAIGCLLPRRPRPMH